MALINSIAEYQEYFRAGQALKRLYNASDIKSAAASMPEALQRLFNKPEDFTLADISHEAVIEMLKSRILKREPDFVIDDCNRLVIDQIVKYLRRDPTFLKTPGNSFDKGLLLRGGVGTGKTLLMHGLRSFIGEMRFFRLLAPGEPSERYDLYEERGLRVTSLTGPAFLTTGEIVLSFNVDGFQIFTHVKEGRKTDTEVITARPMILDDLGTENLGLHFGARTNVISELLMMRYERFVAYRRLNNSERREYSSPVTHGTSNLNTNELQEFYGDRVFDRMRELFNDIVCDGESRRK